MDRPNKLAWYDQPSLSFLNIYIKCVHDRNYRILDKNLSAAVNTFCVRTSPLSAMSLSLSTLAFVNSMLDNCDEFAIFAKYTRF